MRIIIIVIYLLSFGTLSAQTLSDFGGIPNKIQDTISVMELLAQLKWDSIDEFCKENNGLHLYVNEKGLLREFRYIKQGNVESFKILSYQGQVLEFRFNIPELKRTNEYFFDKKLWLQYVNEIIPDLPDSLLLTEDEPINLLKGFYWLLGVDAVDEYGWVCEYSAIGMLPTRRKGVITLIENNRIDLLRKLMSHTNPQIKLYAIDALIYMDKIDNILSEQDWQYIFGFRDSGTIIKTCGNMGSYKIYETPIAELLSKKAIKRIPKNYKLLNSRVYFSK